MLHRFFNDEVSDRKVGLAGQIDYGIKQAFTAFPGGNT